MKERLSFGAVLGTVYLIMLIWPFLMAVLAVWTFGFGFFTLQILFAFVATLICFHIIAGWRRVRCVVSRRDLAAVDYLALVVAGFGLLAVSDVERKSADQWVSMVERPVENYGKQIPSSISASIRYWCETAFQNRWNEIDPTVSERCSWSRKAENVYKSGYDKNVWREFFKESFILFDLSEDTAAWWQRPFLRLCLVGWYRIFNEGKLVNTLNTVFCPRRRRSIASQTLL